MATFQQRGCMHVKLISKQEIADEKGVTTVTVDKWVAGGLLPPPMKFGSTRQARVRWTDAAVKVLDGNLAALSDNAPVPKARTAEVAA